MLKIVHIPNKVLSTPTKPVAIIDDRIKKLVADMEAVLKAQNDPPGVGLAANQVGINLSLFIIRPTLKSKIKAFINPKIIKLIESKTNTKKTGKTKKSHQPVKLEGCLSIPRIWGPVNRAKSVTLEYQDVTGKKITQEYTGFEATIIQHEMDHLSGIVFTQRSLEQHQELYKEVKGELSEIEI